MNGKKYLITLDKKIWVIILIVSALVFFPAFIVFLVLWAMNKIKIED